jgi:hypothetical protein
MYLKTRLLAATFACVMIAALATAEEERKLKLVLATNEGDAPFTFEVDGDEMAIGETREIDNPAGKKIELTRTEEGFEVTIDGKKLDLDHQHHHFGDAKGFSFSFNHGDDEAEHSKHFEKHVIMHRVDGHAGDKNKVKIVMKGDGIAAIERLESSGALDKLDAETRQKVLDALAGVEVESSVDGDDQDHKVIIIRTQKKDEEKSEDGGQV